MAGGSGGGEGLHKPHVAGQCAHWPTSVSVQRAGASMNHQHPKSIRFPGEISATTAHVELSTQLTPPPTSGMIIV